MPVLLVLFQLEETNGGFDHGTGPSSRPLFSACTDEATYASLKPLNKCLVTKSTRGEEEERRLREFLFLVGEKIQE